MRFQVSHAGGGDGRRTRIELSMTEEERRGVRQIAVFLPALLIVSFAAVIIFGRGSGHFDWRTWAMAGVCLAIVAAFIGVGMRSTFATIACDGEFISTTRPWGARPEHAQAAPLVRPLGDVVSVRKQVAPRGRYLRVRFANGPGLMIPMARDPSDAGRRFAEALCGMIRARKPEAFMPVRKTSPWPRHGAAAACGAAAAAWVVWVMPKLGPGSALSIAVPLALMAGVGLIEGTRRVWEEI